MKIRNKIIISIILLAGIFPLPFFKNAFAHNLGGITTIHMTKNGFEPSAVEIKNGDTVIFENTDSRDRWPASNIHPTHGIYPEFDPKKAIPSGKTWAFTFARVGIWKFHDHIFPDHTGQITVKVSQNQDSESASKPLSASSTSSKKARSMITRLADFFDAAKFFVIKKYYGFFASKLEAKLTNINMVKVAGNPQELLYWIKILGPEKTMKELISDSNNGNNFECHQGAHQIGRFSYKVFGAEVFKKADYSCHSGFNHGAMESFLQAEGTENIASNIEKVCGQFKNSFINFECFHGVGHGVMAYSDYDLNSAITTCRRLSANFHKTSCYGGVFMENIITARGEGASPGHKTQWVNNDPHFPCNQLESDLLLRQECYKTQTSWMFTLANWDYDLVIKRCLQATQDMISICFGSYGRDIAGHVHRDPKGIINLCNKIPRTEDYYDQCLISAQNAIIDFFGPDLKDQANKLCEQVDLDFKNICYKNLMGRLNQLFPELEKRKGICQYFEPNHQDYCLKNL